MFLDMKTINLPAKEKETEFSKYLLERNPSEKFIRTYGIYLRSNVVKKYVQENSRKQDIFQVEDLEELFDIYDAVKLDDNNIRLHNVYSGAISAYIKFLEGKPLRIKASKEKKDAILDSE